MLGKELKQSLKGLLIWIAIFTVFFIVIIAIYPSIIQDTTALDELIKTMPPEILKVFNMDIASLNSIQNWILTEGYLFITLIGGIYFAILGSSLLLKEQDEGTINFLAVKPISRHKIVRTKVICGIIHVILFNLILGIIILIGCIINDDINYMKWILAMINPAFLHLFIMMLSMNLSLLYKKVSKAIMGGIGISFGFYILSVLAGITDKIEFLKYMTPFFYTDSRSIIESSKLITGHAIIMLVASIVLIITLHLFYSKKELS